MIKPILSALALVCLTVYFFVSAPAELPKQDQSGSGAQAVSVEALFQAVNSINAHARQIYTSEIVGAGKKVGLKFGEDWKEEGVEKGPLPALFLRELSSELEKRPEPLGLYLGSDEPINPSNLFKGDTAIDYKTVVANRAPVFSELAGYGSIAMFPDFASAPACVSCHNEHVDSPKTDWKLNDVMGATTWTWPKTTTTAEEMRQIVRVEIEALGDAYQNYLDKTAGFAAPPLVGDSWPRSGEFVLPSREVYLSEVIKASGSDALLAFLEAK